MDGFFVTELLNEAPADEGLGWHPVLEPMAALANRWMNEGQRRGWDIWHALAECNNKPSFARTHVRAERST